MAPYFEFFIFCCLIGLGFGFIIHALESGDAISEDKVLEGKK